jgi:hypothetical protein
MVVGVAVVLGVVSCGSDDDSAPSSSGGHAGTAATGGAATGGAATVAGSSATGGRAGNGGSSGHTSTSAGNAGRGGVTSSNGGCPIADGGASTRAGATSGGESGNSADAGSGTEAGNAGADSSGGSGPVTVGEWTDAPGECPAGSTRVDITTLDEMESASRGESDQTGTCFFVHDGTYTQSGSTIPLYFMRGGSAGAPIVWVGESRSGVVIQGRATFEVGSDHIQLSNMTLDISTVTQTGAYNTITVFASDVTLSHLTLTGDCAHGSQGGHIEVPGQDDPSAPLQDHVVIDSCLIEKFGHCDADGSLDHGIYLSSGNDIQIRNSIIRGNSSRGIQIYTHYEDSSLTLTNLLIERNLIEANGHGDYQDGMVINGNVDSNFTGPIDGVTIRNNIFWQNFYSAIRFAGNSVTGVSITNNTFVDDGSASTASGRSELNLDDGTPVASAKQNLFAPATTVVNSCVDSLQVVGNFDWGGSPGGTCVTGFIRSDPQFTDAANGDFHTGNPLATGFGAYGP